MALQDMTVKRLFQQLLAHAKSKPLAGRLLARPWEERVAS